MGEASPRSKAINEAIQFVLPRLTDRADLSSASQVCTAWYEADRQTREHVTVPLCYAAKPCRLSGRFPNLKSLQLKGRPRSEMREPWGSFATPWINEIAISKLSVLNSIRFKRIIISDLDLDVLARALQNNLKVFELKRCSGFTSDGLLSVTKRCRKIEYLLLSWNTLVEENNGEWLHQVALHNTHLRALHCYQTDISKVSIEDLETIAKTCSSSLVSLKISGFDLLKLQGTLREANVLEEFYGGCIVVDDDPRKYFNANLYFPPKLCRVGALVGLSMYHASIMFGFSSRLKTLDLFGTELGCYAHRTIFLRRVPNLEILKTSTCIGDEGLDVLSQYCKKLKELEIRVASDRDDRERYIVTEKGVVPVIKNCTGLECIALCMMRLGNRTLDVIAENLKELRSFDLEIIRTSRLHVEETLDYGVRALLMRCEKLRKMRLCLLSGCITYVGMTFIAEFGSRLRIIKLFQVGDSEEGGLDDLARGCQDLQRLELTFCLFSGREIATAVTKLPKLRYIRVCGYEKFERKDLCIMSRPGWTIDIGPSTSDLVAYASLGNELSDYPEKVQRFN